MKRIDTPWASMLRVDRVVILRLYRPAQNSDELHMVTRFVDHAHRECGQSVIMLALPAPGLSPPEEHIRGLVVRNIKQRFQNGTIEHAVLVVPSGSAIRRAVVRSIFTGARLVLGLPNRILIVEGLDEATDHISSRFGISADTLIAPCRTLIDHHPAQKTVDSPP